MQKPQRHFLYNYLFSSQMKANAIELSSGHYKQINTSKKLILPVLTLALLITIHLYTRNFPQLHITNLASLAGNSSNGECNIYYGSWVFDDERELYYTNETKCQIDDRQNCMKYGRPDTEFMKWRWKPDECELPQFDAAEFLELVTGKTMAFIGDSVGRNQMESLVCMLASAASPVDNSTILDERFRRWFYPTHNFTLLTIRSHLLIKTRDPSPNKFTYNSIMNLYLDEADETWTSQIEGVDIAIFSAGQWFFRPFMYYENGTLVGCRFCNKENITELSSFYAYKMAYRSVFKTLLSMQNYTGVTYLRTFSPDHFENGDWNNGGNCIRKRPYTREEMMEDWFRMKMHSTQVEEFRAAEREGGKQGLKFRLLDTTEAMMMRPDGHPSLYGHYPGENKTTPDCVHWCMPGPVDTWNEFLLQMLKAEEEGSIKRMLQKNVLV